MYFLNLKGGIIIFGVNDNNMVTGFNIDNTTHSKLETRILARKSNILGIFCKTITLFSGNLFSQYENSIRYIKSKLETRYEIKSQGTLLRKEILEITLKIVLSTH